MKPILKLSLLLACVVLQFSFAGSASAADGCRCTGSVSVNSFGTFAASSGGYDLEGLCKQLKGKWSKGNCSGATADLPLNTKEACESATQESVMQQFGIPSAVSALASVSAKCTWQDTSKEPGAADDAGGDDDDGGDAAVSKTSGLQVIPSSCIDSGTGSAPSLDCIVKTFVSVGRIFFGISGSFALLMFVIGGFYYITSAGSEEKVKKGKEYIRNAVTGLVIILTAAYGIEYGMNALLGKTGCLGTAYVDSAGKAQCCKSGIVATVATGAAKGTQKCVTGTGAKACSEIGEGYARADITQRADKGANCISGIFPKEKDEIRCCPEETK
jgi:hypothetical protein